MRCWIFVFNPLERYMANYKHIFDAWEEGGVRGIVVGRMFFTEDDGGRIPAFPQDPQAYADLGLAARVRRHSAHYHVLFSDRPGLPADAAVLRLSRRFRPAPLGHRRTPRAI